MRIRDLILGLDKHRESINKLMMEKNKDILWKVKYLDLKNNYYKDLSNINFGKIKKKEVNWSNIENLSINKKINESLYSNIKYNKNLYEDRIRHPIIYIEEENNELIGRYFKNKNLRLIQKEKAAEIFYWKFFREKPIALDVSFYDMEYDKTIIENLKTLNYENIKEQEIFDVTNASYKEINVDERILGYTKYKREGEDYLYYWTNKGEEILKWEE